MTDRVRHEWNYSSKPGFLGVVRSVYDKTITGMADVATTTCSVKGEGENNRSATVLHMQCGSINGPTLALPCIASQNLSHPLASGHALGPLAHARC